LTGNDPNAAGYYGSEAAARAAYGEGANLAFYKGAGGPNPQGDYYNMGYYTPVRAGG
jgi:hypothetical protein